MWLALDGDGPLYRQAYRALRAAILDGRLAPGERLPSSRVLARDAKLARNTVLQAYEQLVAEGYADSRRGAGTFVVAALPEASARGARPARARAAVAVAPPVLSAYAERALRQVARGVSWGRRRPAPRYDFRYGDPAYDDFPHETWCRLLARRARRASERHLSYSDPGGAPELREALAGYLSRARGVSCEPDDLLVVYGTQQAIDLTARVLIDPGASAIVEEPGYPGHPPCARDRRCRGDGARGRRGWTSHRRARGAARASLVRDTFAPVPDRRRAAARAPARAARVGRALERIRARGRLRRRVPLRRATARIAPGARSQRTRAVCGHHVQGDVSRTAHRLSRDAAGAARSAARRQGVRGYRHGSSRAARAGRLHRAGFFERHLRRARTRNAARRAALLAALARELGDAVEVVGANAGLHVVAWLRGVLPGELRTLRELAVRREVGIHPISPFYAARPRRAGILLGYAALDESAIAEGVHRLASALRELRAA
jgi:GntR family transcriptional regulator/MocR family aminotransferase